MLTTGTPELELGSLDLIDDSPAPGVAYYFKALGEGSTLGNPVPVQRSLDTLLTDGSKVVTDRHDNREPAFMVQIIAPDSAALSDGEAALFLELARTDLTLTYRNPDGIGARTVYEVVTASMDHEWDDINERRMVRTYSLRLIAAPFGRSEFETTVEALTVGAGSESTISDGTSATGWSSPDGAVTVSSGKLLIPAQASPDSTYATVDSGTYGVYTPEATVTIAAADFSTTPYLYFDYLPSVAGRAHNVQAVYADGVELLKIGDYWVSSTVGRRGVFLCTDSSVTSLRIVFEQAVPVGSNCGVLLDNVKRGPRTPKASTTGRESIRSLAVEGSARTQVSLRVGHASAGLGDTIVYTAPGLGEGYSPDLQQFYVTGGSSTSDATLVSGTRTTLSTAAAFDVPVSSLPAGGYVLLARVRGSSAGDYTVDWTASTRIGSTDLDGAQSGSSQTLGLDATAWRIVTLGGMVLPPTEAGEGSSAVVRVTLDTGTSPLPGDDVEVDQAWLFYCGDDAALTVISAGAGTPALGSIHNYLWVDSPTLDRDRPTVWLGASSSKLDVLHGGAFASAWGLHLFPPGRVGVFVATTGATDAAVSGTYHARWHTHAGS